MSRDTRIELVAPPFAGHLFPLLDLARYLRGQGWTNLRVLSTKDAAEAVRLCELPFVELLPGQADRVRQIADTESRVGFHPLRLYRQFRMNLALMDDLRAQLREGWTAERPALVLADFTVPVAGLLAQALGIPWWTSMPSPCALETRTGTPSYLGGWFARKDFLARLRDACGRTLIHGFKRGVAALFARELRALDLPQPYRPDGTEAIYSSENILGLGMREFEFERDWPASFQFIGPLTGCPPFPHEPPVFPEGRPCILVTLGTHLPWARAGAARLVAEVARAMPDCVFHFAQGKPGSTERTAQENVHVHGFIPYDAYLDRYTAAIIHGGTGITYGCIKAGVPTLVWPHDYDQYDHAARIVAAGIGLRLRPTAVDVVADLRRLLTDEGLRSRARDFQRLARNYDAGTWVGEALARQFSCG